MAGGPLIGVDGLGKHDFDAGAQHLDGDLATIIGDTAMHLRHRGGANGNGVDRGEVQPPIIA